MRVDDPKNMFHIKTLFIMKQYLSQVIKTKTRKCKNGREKRDLGEKRKFIKVEEDERKNRQSSDKSVKLSFPF